MISLNLSVTSLLTFLYLMAPLFHLYNCYNNSIDHTHMCTYWTVCAPTKRRYTTESGNHFVCLKVHSWERSFWGAHTQPAQCLWWRSTAGNIWMYFRSVYISKMLKNYTERERQNSEKHCRCQKSNKENEQAPKEDCLKSITVELVHLHTHTLITVGQFQLLP